MTTRPTGPVSGDKDPDEEAMLLKTITRQQAEQIRDTMRKLLSDRYTFTHFVTLAANDQMVSDARMRDLLKEWDARVARAVIGPKWLKRPDERVLWFAFLEKPGIHPHWHVLADTRSPYMPEERADQISERFDLAVQAEWLKITRTGTVVTKRVENGRVNDYVTKALSGERGICDFVTCREFR